MKLTQQELKSIIFIQANIRGFLVRQEIRRQLLEIYEYEKEQLEYLQGQQLGQDEYYDYQYNLNRDSQQNNSEKYIIQSSHAQYEEQKKKIQNIKRSISSNNQIQDDVSEENIEFHKSCESSSAEIEKKVQQKYMQQQMNQRERQQAYEYQLHPVELNKQKTKEFQTDTQKNLNGVCLATGKNEAEVLKFPQVHPIFSNSQMKMMMNSSNESQDESNFQEKIHQNQEKLKNIAEKLKKEEEEIDQFSQDNIKIKHYSHSANFARNLEEDSEDQEQARESQPYAQMQQKKENIENKNNKGQDSQMKYQKENHKEQDYLDHKSVNISVEISESNLLSERRQNILPTSNYNQNKIQKNSDKQQLNIYANQNGTQMKMQQNGQAKVNQNRFYQEEEENYYLNQQINLYQQQKYQGYEKVDQKQNKEDKHQQNNKYQNIIQVIDQFNYSPNSNTSSKHIKDSHFAKISNIEYNSYPCDQFLFEESQNYGVQQRFADDYYGHDHHHYHHQHHQQLASYSQPQENNELIIDKSIYIKNMKVIKEMQQQQTTEDKEQRSANHEKNMKKIRKMIHQNQILNNKNRKNFLQLSKYSLESFQYSQIIGGDSKYQVDSEVEVNLLDTTQQQKHNNGQIFEMSSKSNSMMSSRVPDSQNLISQNQLNNLNKSKTKNNNNSSTRSEGTTNSNILVNSLNKKPIMFDFDIYILAATKIQKVFKGYLSRKLIIEFRSVKRAALIIEAQYLKFKQFLVKKMKDCNNQIECSSYNIIKLVQDFEKGEKFLKSQFRKKNFDQKIKVNRDKLCKVFIKFINTNEGDENCFSERAKMTAEQENLILQKQVLKLKQYILQQQTNYKQELDQMQSKYEELRSLHKETIKKYISGIQNLKKRGSNQGLIDSNLQEESSQYMNNSSPKYAKSKVTNDHQNLLQKYKEGDSDINKINFLNNKNKQENRNHFIQDQNNIQKFKKHGSSADTKRKSSNKSPERVYLQKQFEALTHEAEKDLEDFESQIKKIKYDYSNSNKQYSPSNHSKKVEEKRSSKNNTEIQNKEQQLYIKKCKQKQQQTKDVQNSIHQQYMSDEFANNSKFSMNSQSKQ